MMKKCKYCKQSFNAHTAEVKYCSKKCYSASMYTGKEIKCKICGKKFYVNKYRLDTQNPQYCSTKCGCQIAKLKGEEVACIVCGKTVYSRKRDLSNKRFCSNICKNKFVRGKNHHNYNGGIVVNSNGYLLELTKNGYINQHRSIMEKHLGRKLKKKEIVHHINEDRTDNRIENLMLFPNTKAHLGYHRQLRKFN